ncbi:MAG: hypothetical protein V3T05_10970 [Myxococcota bacterium]
MSTRGVIRLMTDTLVRNQGMMTEADFQKVVDYANRGDLTAGEKTAMLQPSSYLETKRAFNNSGLTLEDIRFDDGALRLARELSEQYGIDLFPGLTGVGGGDTPPPPATDLATAKEALAAAMATGKDLGTFEDWSLQTSGADVKFSADGGRFGIVPALVLDKPQFKDPDARNLIGENADAISNISTAAELTTFIEDVSGRESAYFAAEGVESKYATQTFGIQNMRRKAFVNGLERALGNRVEGSGRVLVEASEAMVVGRDFDMETGSHTNYWPYWNNYADFLLTVLKQTDPESDAYLSIKNRVADIFRRKTVFGWNRSINEKDFETSINGAVVYNPQYSQGDGHRISIKEGSTPRKPKYELLSVKASGLPDDLEEYAGANVVRVGDELVFDWMGEDAQPNRSGQTIPDGLEDYIESKAITGKDLQNLALRELKSGESARSDISMDWDSNGVINVAEIMIGWWGHCHNEAPLNAKGIDPQKAVEMYRADRGVQGAEAMQTYSAEDAWDVAGAFTADHEQGYRVLSSGATARVDDTDFVAERNNGGHWLSLTFKERGMPRIRIDAEVTELWSKTDPTKQYSEPMSRFRRDIENDDGTFSPNPEWINAGARDGDIITIDAKDRKMSVTTKFITFNSSGRLYEKKERVTLDPSKDEFVKLSEEVLDEYAGGGGQVTEHWYNAKTGEYQSVIQELKSDDNFERQEISRSDKVATDTVRSAQETTYDSVVDIHNFVISDMGLPFTFDTSSGMAVWNYPVGDIRVDRQQIVEKEENGQMYTYTTYRLKYDTMGGPSGDSRYIIKRDAEGRVVRATALDPMPDFAYRQDHWVCAPVTLDANGDVAYNVAGATAGYLTNKARNLITDLWQRQAAILYSSLSDATAENKAYVFENQEGHLVSFADSETFDAAVAADMKVRELEAGTPA